MKTFYYENETDDLVESKNQNFKLKDNYKWIHKNIIYIFFSYIVYYIVLLIAVIYFYLIKREKIVFKEKNKYKNCFVYSNHTLTIGDILNPFILSFPHRPYLICSPANLGIPVIGKLLPIAGALPIPDTLSKQKEFINGIKYRCNKGNPIYIYPEAHLWPYYTKIREFNNSAFHFPVDNSVPIYVHTTTFKKGNNNKPKITIYESKLINAPLEYSRKEKIKYYHDETYSFMVEKSKYSTFEYNNYQKRG